MGRALPSGHLPSVAKAIVGHNQLQELVFAIFGDKINAGVTSFVSVVLFVSKNSNHIIW